jgi:hypothetical protein
MNEKIAAVFTHLIRTSHTFSWETVVKEIKTANIPVKNWMRVRRLMQELIADGTISRIDSVYVEEYRVNLSV